MKRVFWMLLAAVAIFGAYVWDQLDANAEADAFAREVAVEMQAACQRDLKCPQAPPGWKTESSQRAVTEVRGMRVDYRVLPDRATFRVSVYHVVGSILDIHGGVAKATSEQRAIR
jgi:hypothetical protein